MLRVSLNEVKPTLQNLTKKNARKSNQQTVKAFTQKAVPGIIVLGSGVYALSTNSVTNQNTKKAVYEPCSDFCMEVVG